MRYQRFNDYLAKFMNNDPKVLLQELFTDKILVLSIYLQHIL